MKLRDYLDQTLREWNHKTELMQQLQEIAREYPNWTLNQAVNKISSEAASRSMDKGREERRRLRELLKWLDDDKPTPPP